MKKFSDLVRKLRGKRPLLAVLVDPDKFNPELIRISQTQRVDCFLVGGSKLHEGDITQTVTSIKNNTTVPVVLFPGDEYQLTGRADGLLLLSLLSGRNPDYLIGKHVKAAPRIKKLGLQTLPTAYLLIGSGKVSTTQRITQTHPIASGSTTEILHTCLAAEQLGFKAIYLEAGSGSRAIIPAALVRKIRNTVSIPVIVGGGIDSPAKAKQLIRAGANMLVVGNALENDPGLLTRLSLCF